MELNSSTIYSTYRVGENYEEFSCLYEALTAVTQNSEPEPSRQAAPVHDIAMKEIQEIIKGVSRLRINSSIAPKVIRSFSRRSLTTTTLKTPIQKPSRSQTRSRSKKFERTTRQHIRVLIEHGVRSTPVAVTPPAAATTPAPTPVAKKSVRWAPQADHRQTFITGYYQQKIDVIDETNRHLSEKILTKRATSSLVSFPPRTVASLKERSRF